MRIIDTTGLSYPTVHHEQGGWSAIRPADRGRDMGDARILNVQQEADIRQII